MLREAHLEKPHLMGALFQLYPEADECLYFLKIWTLNSVSLGPRHFLAVNLWNMEGLMLFKLEQWNYFFKNIPHQLIRGTWLSGWVGAWNQMARLQPWLLPLLAVLHRTGNLTFLFFESSSVRWPRWWGVQHLSLCSCLAQLLIDALFIPQGILIWTIDYIVALPIIEPTSEYHFKNSKH